MNSVVQMRPMRLSDTEQVPSGKKTPRICRKKNSSRDCRATQSCDSGRLLSFTDVSFTFWNNNHTCQRDLRHASRKIQVRMFYSTPRHEKSTQNAGLPQRLVQDCVDPGSKQLNIFKRVKSPRWLLLREARLKQKSTAWSRKALRGHALSC